MTRYLKFGAQVLATALAAAVVALQNDGRISSSEWVNVLILALGAVAVLGAGELPGSVWAAAKTYVAAATAGAVALQSYVTGGITPVELMQIALAVAGALGVHAVAGPPQPGPLTAAPRPDPLAEQWDADFEAWKADLRSDDTQEIPRVTAPVAQRIPEQVIPGRRLGRHVRHDPRSLSYLIPETTTPTTAMWQRRVPVFDQGDTGSCTGNAAAGVLGTSPFYETLPAGLVDDEGEAVKLYGAATALDDYPGTYPPDDTGSDGLSVAKACQQAGLISGYQHITSVAAAQTAIKTGPFIVGVNWYSSMDNPDANGLVKVSGQIRGGHEFECHGYDAQADLWWFTNSWGDSWGKDGTFCMSSASFARLLSEQGDATVFLPIAAPFPPSPEPPAPTPGPDPAPTGFPLAAYEAFRQHRYSRPKAVEFMKECDAWLNGG